MHREDAELGLEQIGLAGATSASTVPIVIVIALVAFGAALYLCLGSRRRT